jgi:RHS repeat-associated protein
VLDDKHVLNELDASQAGKPSIRRYHYGTKVLAVTESAGTSYILNDGIGSASDFWNSSGLLAKSRQYDAWGNFRNGTAPTSTDAKVAYTGHQYDPETGWVYAKARYYDSGLGVFLSRDSFEGDILTAPSLHRYMYGWDNPLRYYDPYGYGVADDAWNVLTKAQQYLFWNPILSKMVGTTKTELAIAIVATGVADEPQTRMEAAHDLNMFNPVYSGLVHAKGLSDADESAKAQGYSVENTTALVGNAVGLGMDVAGVVLPAKGYLSSPKAVPARAPEPVAQNTVKVSVEGEPAGAIGGTGSPRYAQAPFEDPGCAGGVCTTKLPIEGSPHAPGDVPDSFPVNRIGGGSAENLALKPREATLNPPGISVLQGGTPQEAAATMRQAFPNATGIQQQASTVGSATAKDVRAAGFDLKVNPSKKLPTHVRLTHPKGEKGFSPENRQALSERFKDTSTPEEK